MDDITEKDFTYILDKLRTTIQKHQLVYPELSLLDNYIQELGIVNRSRFAYLATICEFTKEKATSYYVIRFIHIRLEKDIEKLAKGSFAPDDQPFYLEFA